MHVSNGKGRLYSGLQDRSTRVRGNMLGLSKTSIFRRCLAAWGKNQPTVYININEITMKQKLLQQCIIVSCNNLTMLPSSLPRHPREQAKLGTNSLIVIVSSSMIWLQHKASCYRGHGYSNRLIFPAGVHWRDSTTLGSPRWREPG